MKWCYIKAENYYSYLYLHYYLHCYFLGAAAMCYIRNWLSDYSYEPKLNQAMLDRTNFLKSRKIVELSDEVRSKWTQIKLHIVYKNMLMPDTYHLKQKITEKIMENCLVLPVPTYIYRLLSKWKCLRKQNKINKKRKENKITKKKKKKKTETKQKTNKQKTKTKTKQRNKQIQKQTTKPKKKKSNMKNLIHPIWAQKYDSTSWLINLFKHIHLQLYDTLGSLMVK